MLSWLRRKKPSPTYVVIYDLEIEPLSHEWIEEYYGYFCSREEALTMYGNLVRNHEALYKNAKLCVVVEDIGAQD